MRAVKNVGKHAQAAISYAVTPVHTLDLYVALARELRQMGADSICIKDMAGLLRPYAAFDLVQAIRQATDLPVHVHSHATTGMSVAALVKAVEAGAELLDTTISSLAMGTSHSPTETMVEILRGTPWDPGLDLKLLVEIAAYFRDIRRKYKAFESSFLGADTRILVAQVPGGMLSNLESQLKEMKQSAKLDAVLAENALVQKDFGYPPLVTPTSQIVGTQAVFNVIFGRYEKLTSESCDLLVGNYGRTPAAPNPDLVARALKQLNLAAPVTARPAEALPNEMPRLEQDLKKALGVARVTREDVLTTPCSPDCDQVLRNAEGGWSPLRPARRSCGQACRGPCRRRAGAYVVTVGGSTRCTACPTRSQGLSRSRWRGPPTRSASSRERLPPVRPPLPPPPGAKCTKPSRPCRVWSCGWSAMTTVRCRRAIRLWCWKR